MLQDPVRQLVNGILLFSSCKQPRLSELGYMGLLG